MSNISFNFDEKAFAKQIQDAAEKAFKDNVSNALRRPGCENVKVSYSGSLAREDLKVNLSGPDDELAEAQKRLQE